MRLFLRLRRKNARSAITARTPSTTPIPMPAFAPVLRLSDDVSAWGLDADDVAAGLGEVVDFEEDEDEDEVEVELMELDVELEVCDPGTNV